MAVTGPVFVVGPMRSGTTLVRLVLDAHPDLAIPEETAFMAGAANAVRIPGWRYGDVWFERLGLDRSDVVAGLRDFYTELFSRWATTQSASRWGDKTPLHVFHMELMAEMFPDACFVGVVRHPAAVVSSMVSKWRREPVDAASYWTRATTEMIRVGRQLGEERFVLVRYEDLVADAEPVLRDVCRLCHLAWDDALLRHDQVQAERGGPRQTDGWTDTARPVDADLATAWLDRVDPELRGVVEQENSALATWLGYRMDAAAPRPLERDGRVVATLSASHLDELTTARGAPTFEPQSEDLIATDADPAELAARLAATERELRNLKRRGSVRAVDAARNLQRAGVRATVAELRDLWRRR